ncbi:hypothetical protein QJQ45_017521 [Haematococcus lacustris]|nr:hypothetical protein QJQ45_017521 [Haematococcus lacustris]
MFCQPAVHQTSRFVTMPTLHTALGLALLIAALHPALGAMSWRPCSDSEGPIAVSDVTLTPDPPVIGCVKTFQLMAGHQCNSELALLPYLTGAPQPLLSTALAVSALFAWSHWVQLSTCLAVPAGAVEIQVSFSGIQIYSESQDLCSKTACPVPPGPVTINIVEDLPPIAPPVSKAQDQLQGTANTSPLSGDYGLRVIGTDASGNELMCLDVDFELVLPSESTSLRHLVPGSTGKTQEHIMLATGMAAEHIKQMPPKRKRKRKRPVSPAQSAAGKPLSSTKG